MIIHYISPSILPSRSANAVHVAKQCDALAKCCDEVRCYARRSISASAAADQRIKVEYGLTSPNLIWKTHFFPYSRATNLVIALHACLMILIAKQGYVLSRNLYASFIWGVLFSRKLVFETHQLEPGIGRWMQRKLIRRSNVTTIVISKKLEKILEEYHCTRISKCVVLHDAASDAQRSDSQMKADVLMQSLKIDKGEWRSICGYFGHLYSGRGIEVIIAMAAEAPDDLFLVVGGAQSDIDRLRAEHQNAKNLKILGFMPHNESLRLMKSVDVLLMPYQKSVSIGVKGHDTARWMSPMKMFEYMACGVPIISSELEVLKEVLTDEVNALLVTPDSVSEWSAALRRIQQDTALAKKIGGQAYLDYRKHYTWDNRAERIVAELR